MHAAQRLPSPPSRHRLHGQAQNAGTQGSQGGTASARLQQAEQRKRRWQQPGRVRAATECGGRRLGQQRDGPAGRAHDGARQQHLRQRRRRVARPLGRRGGLVECLPCGTAVRFTYCSLGNAHAGACHDGSQPTHEDCDQRMVITWACSRAPAWRPPGRRTPHAERARRTPSLTGDLASALAGAPMKSAIGRRSAPASAAASAPRMLPAPMRAPGMATAHAPSSAWSPASTRAATTRVASSGAAVTTLAVSPTCTLRAAGLAVRASERG